LKVATVLLPFFLQCQNLGTKEDIYVGYIDSDGDEVIVCMFIVWLSVDFIIVCMFIVWLSVDFDCY
jgi:hypothetical protein